MGDEKPDLLKVLHHYGSEAVEHRVSQLARCINPQHEDAKASLSINLTKQLVNCMACGLRGDVYDVVMALEGIGFAASRERAAEIAGSPAPVSARGGRVGLSGSAGPARGGYRPRVGRGSRKPLQP